MDVEEFDAALAASFSENGFVSSLRPADPQGKSFLAVCKCEKSEVPACPADRPSNVYSLGLTVTDCLSGIFRQRFGFTELTEMRREVGMAEFAWGTFLKLLASAFRSHGGCSAVVELQPSATTPAAAGPVRMQLTLRFQLQAAALVTRVDLGTCTDGPSPAPGIDSYLSELHSFVVGAVTAACGSGANHEAPQDIASQSQSLRLPKDAFQLPGQSLGAATNAGALTNSTGSTTSRRTESTPGSSKKRAGSLVDPHARRVRGAGANPFQLSRAGP